MIRRKRPPAPAALAEPFTGGPHEGLSERDAAITEFARTQASKEKYEFKFRRYKHPDVVAALEGTFTGKCAYCESRYAAVQPVDVDHWRPKAGVSDLHGKPLEHPGYYWLAADWDNLLPSCIDCNRRRLHDTEGAPQALGKHTRFPLAPGSSHASGPDDDLSGEDPLLLNPFTDDPDEHLAFDPSGVVFAREGGARGLASIAVYGLNRGSLVRERMEVAQLMEMRLRRLDVLTSLAEQLRASSLPAHELAAAIESVADAVGQVLEEIAVMRLPSSPYSAFARALSREVDGLKL